MNMKRFMNKKVVAIGLAAGLTLGAAGAAFAYFTSTGTGSRVGDDWQQCGPERCTGAAPVTTCCTGAAAQTITHGHEQHHECAAC